MNKVKIRLKRSLIGRRKNQIATVHALGLKKIGNIVEHNKSSEILGMISKVKFLLEIIEV